MNFAIVDGINPNNDESTRGQSIGLNDHNVEQNTIMTLQGTTKRVGIGSTNPSASLDVNGNVDISGNTFSNNVFLQDTGRITFGSQWILLSTGDDFQFYTGNPSRVDGNDYERNGNYLVGYVQDDMGSVNQHVFSPMNFTGQHRTFIENTSHDDISANKMSGLIVCANKNEYVKMSGGIAEGNDAIQNKLFISILSENL